MTVDNGALTDFTAASDDVGGVQYPRVKIDGGADGAAAPITGDTTNGLDVDVTRIVPGTGATNLGKAEDVPHASGDVGVMALTVRKDSAAALAGSDGDYQALLTDSSGRLHISPLPAGSELIGDVTISTVTPGTGGANLGKAEDAAHASGDTGILALAVRQDTLASSTSTDGDYAALKVAADGSLYVNVSSLPAASRTTDSIGVAPQTGIIMQGLTEKTPVFAAIDVAGSGDNTLVAAQGASNKIRVHQVFLVASGAVNVRFESGAGGTALTGQMNVSANGGFVLPFSPLGWFETAANTLLNLELSSAVSVDGCLAYSVVT